MLGDELRKARLAAGLSQEALAVKAGITREFISIVENGRQSPSVDTFMDICRAMGVAGWVVLRRVESGTSESDKSLSKA